MLETAIDIGSTLTEVVCLQDQHCDTPVYACRCLPLGAQLHGLAIIEQPAPTMVVYPGQHCQVDRAGNLLSTASERA